MRFLTLVFRFMVLVLCLPQQILSSSTNFRGGYSTLSNAHLPHPGSIYKSAFRLPVIGNQVFQLSVYEGTRAHLSIEGVMSVDAVVDYSVCSKSGTVSFLLPESVVKVLKRFRTRLLEARYIPESDTVIIKVLPPLPRHIVLELRRL
jgi:hypothetical protein